jgi:hypothetical protein
MHDEGLDQPLRLIHATAMPREINGLRPRQQFFKREQIVSHVAFGRGDNRRVPAHDMIAR